MGLAEPGKTRGLTGMGPGLAHQEAAGRVLGLFWNQTTPFLPSKPGPLAGYPDPLLPLGTFDYGSCRHRPNASVSIKAGGRRFYRSHTLLGEEVELTPVVLSSPYGSHHPFHYADVIQCRMSIQ